ncbi:cytochrome c-type biogenesis protein CcmH [Litorilinea aerophila]|uniref:Cytochrome c-type biogenesis protein n=1 Tax=Litorilinea aerophila TaxID=1204385 RepID=A0A540VHV1_9CHLR|nr:cytochrome c-type biogenesis protein [Litorilinea aerophila]MCC9075982.1 cytochrome c-type biogenesis protein CcmH [Litorilinea aerophila]
MSNHPKDPIEVRLSSQRGVTVVLLGALVLVAVGLALLGRGLASNLQVTQASPEALSADQRLIRIADQLQCPICEGQSVAFSNSQLAAEMRRLIAEKLAAGEEEEQIIAYFVERYGVRILREPPRSGLNLWLWITPALAFAVAALGLTWTLWRMARAQPAAVSTPATTDGSGDALDDEVRDLLAQYDEELFSR